MATRNGYQRHTKAMCRAYWKERRKEAKFLTKQPAKKNTKTMITQDETNPTGTPTAAKGGEPSAKGGTLDGDNLQDVLDSAKNAGDKGRQQFFTPLALASALATVLPRNRKVMVDLTMGDGALLRAGQPEFALGIDIDSRLGRKPSHAEGEWISINADLTTVYPLMVEADWTADCFALNPPFSLQWATNRQSGSDRLAALAESPVAAVRETFRKIQRKGVIDSTLATMLIALDRCTEKGEGYMICNQSTAERFFEDAESPGAGILSHIWFWLTIPQGVFDNVRFDFPTAVLYFARSHKNTAPFHVTASQPDAGIVRESVSFVTTQRHFLRRGISVHGPVDASADTVPVFEAIKQEAHRNASTSTNPDYNIWLGVDGTIQRHLTPFQRSSRKISKDKAKTLNDLQGQTPMSLVVQRHTRTTLLQAVHADIWRVEPALVEMVEKCIGDYNANRAPFYPLNDVQRLGYLDEADTIVCKDSWQGFIAGESYKIVCSTEQCERSDMRANLLGKMEHVTLTGQELAINITRKDPAEVTYTFKPIYPKKKLIVRLADRRAGDQWTVTLSDGEYYYVSGANAAIAGAQAIKDGYERIAVREKNAAVKNAKTFSLEELVARFVIPQVPDVTTIEPERFEGYKAKIREIEAGIIERGRIVKANNGGRFPAGLEHRWDPYRAYQIDDIARACMHDGCVFSWDPGLGKTRAGCTIPQVKGAKRVLLVAPESLHEQMIDEAREVFGITVKQIMTHEDYLADTEIQQAKLQRLNGQAVTGEFWRVTSYSALGYNGGDMWKPKEKDDGSEIVNQVILKRRRSHPLYKEELDRGIGAVVRPVRTTGLMGENKIEGSPVRCLYYPTLAVLLADAFDCVEPDEAVRLKSNDSHVSLGIRELQPRYRYPLTATPIKNRLDDIFWLCHWAAGGHEFATARWPYPNTNTARENFADEHMIQEQNHTKEAELANEGKFRKIIKRTPRICNINRLWKLLAPMVIRRRKDDCGEAIVPKTFIPMRVNPGKAQNAVYAFHADNPPEFSKSGSPMSPIAQVVAQLQNLRQAALCPDSPNLSATNISVHQIRQWLADARKAGTVGGKVDVKRTDKAVLIARKGEGSLHLETPFPEEADNAFKIVEAMIDKGDIDIQKIIDAAPTLKEKLTPLILKPNDAAKKSSRSWTDHNPKQAAILKLICDLIGKGEQVVVMSPFQAFSATLYKRLVAAGVSTCLLDGNMDPGKRGLVAKAFKRKKYAVLVAGQKAMGEGHSFECASNLILPSIDWAYDTNAQSIDRVHRLTSTKPVSIYVMVTTNSIDLKLENLFHEKGDSAQLALDGRLFSDRTDEINLGELLRDAIRNFDPAAPTIDELGIEQEWDGFKHRLHHAEQAFREFHPPIVADMTGHRVTPTEVRAAVKATEGKVAPLTPLASMVKTIPTAMFAALLNTHDQAVIKLTVECFVEYCCAHPALTDWRRAWRDFEPQRTKITTAAPASIKTQLDGKAAGAYLDSL